MSCEDLNNRMQAFARRWNEYNANAHSYQDAIEYNELRDRIRNECGINSYIEWENGNGYVVKNERLD